MLRWLKEKRAAGQLDDHAARLARHVLSGRTQEIPTPPRWRPATPKHLHEIRVYAWARRVTRHGAGLPWRNGR